MIAAKLILALMAIGAAVSSGDSDTPARTMWLLILALALMAPAVLL